MFSAGIPPHCFSQRLEAQSHHLNLQSDFSNLLEIGSCGQTGSQQSAHSTPRRTLPFTLPEPPYEPKKFRNLFFLWFKLRFCLQLCYNPLNMIPTRRVNTSSWFRPFSPRHTFPTWIHWWVLCLFVLCSRIRSFSQTSNTIFIKHKNVHQKKKAKLRGEPSFMQDNPEHNTPGLELKLKGSLCRCKLCS